MSNHVKIPMLEVIKRSILYVFAIKKQVLNAIILPVIILALFEVYTGYKTFKIDENYNYNPMLLVQNIIFVIVSCSLYRNILKEEKFGLKSFRFAKDELRFIVAYFLLGIVIAFISIVVGIAIAKLNTLPNKFFLEFIILLSVFALFYIIPKVIMLFPNIIDKGKIFDLKYVYELVQKNNIRIISLTFLYGLIMFAIFIPLSTIFRENLFFVFVYYMFAMMLKIFQISLFGHIYKYLAFFKNKETKEEEKE